MENGKAKLYARLRVKTGEYEQDGKTKNRYSDIGVLFASPHFSNMFIQVETWPINKDFDGRIYVNPIEENRIITVEEDPSGSGQTRQTVPMDDKQMTHEFNKKITQDTVIEDIDDKPIDLSEIPF